MREEALARGHDLALFAAGCFWCPESEFRLIEGVIATAVGFSGGTVPNPNYYSVCSGGTGHAEVLLVEFDPKIVSYGDLVDALYSSHDGEYWGPGDQYRSAIFVYDDAQRAVAERAIEMRRSLGRKIRTEVTDATAFWPAEEYHQQYYEKRGLAKPVGKACFVA
ncbi:peptide-methionine (S)-S-oxide reductase [bacterium]|nr:MAG: peptide-methionine (S)-S-oxide reductase [bacterium]